MFTNKYYTWVYNSTINKAIVRNFGKAHGRERHHIIPRSLGGTNTKSNLVYLTCREHFLCHWLLLKITTGENYHKMLYALMGMRAENEHQERYHTKLTARVYEKYRIEHAAHHSRVMKGRPAWNKGIPQTEKHRQNNIASALTRPPRTAESIAKGLAKTIGLKRSEEFKKAQSLRFSGVPKGPQSDAHRLAISLGSKGKPKKEGHSANVAAAVLGNISINRDGVEKKIKRPDLQTWLDQGWDLGARKRPKPMAQ